mmetsp:Transcript_4200/g.12276  ORF Transcript_4200/g.12276 Transcript_4200/m.12276 type:complete len:220 (+) Transcript_4200:1469-2128(+)
MLRMAPERQHEVLGPQLRHAAADRHGVQRPPRGVLGGLPILEVLDDELGRLALDAETSRQDAASARRLGASSSLCLGLRAPHRRRVGADSSDLARLCLGGGGRVGGRLGLLVSRGSEPSRSNGRIVDGPHRVHLRRDGGSGNRRILARRVPLRGLSSRLADGTRLRLSCGCGIDDLLALRQRHVPGGIVQMLTGLRVVRDTRCHGALLQSATGQVARLT